MKKYHIILSYLTDIKFTYLHKIYAIQTVLGQQGKLDVMVSTAG